MTPTATTLSALLHGLVALALITEMPRVTGTANETAIEITIDLSTPPASLAPEPVAATPQAIVDPPPVAPETVTADAPDPPVPVVAALSIAVPPQPPTTVVEMASEQPMLEPEPQPEPERQEAIVAPRPPEPRLEQALPAVERAPPPPESREFAKAAPAPTPKAAAPRPAMQAAQAVNAVRQAPSLATTANEAVQRQAQEDYLWQVIRKLSQYRYSSTSRDDPERGLVVTRVTLSRDGRLLDVSLAKSSGSPNLDRGIMEAIRRAAPFAPLPADIARDPYVFILPVNYVHER